MFRDWQVEEKFGGTDRYTEFRAKHNSLGRSGGKFWGIIRLTSRVRLSQEGIEDRDSAPSRDTVAPGYESRHRC